MSSKFGRSYYQTQQIRGKTVYTRTVAFKIMPDIYARTTSVHESPFQQQLKLHLERERETVEEWNAAWEVGVCLDFLRSLGGITHYVSSITLGAMEYSVKKVQVSSNTHSHHPQFEMNYYTVSYIPHNSAAILSLFVSRYFVNTYIHS